MSGASAAGSSSSSSGRRRSSSSSVGSNSGPCSVCSDPAEGTHFGAHSCAACGAFFRRSIAEQKVYSCALKNCPVSATIDKSGKRNSICRYCRFEKCLSAGMIPQDVQLKRMRIVQESSPEQTPEFVFPTVGSTPNLEKLVEIRLDMASERHANYSLVENEQLFGACALYRCLKIDWDIFKTLFEKHAILRELIRTVKKEPTESDACPEQHQEQPLLEQIRSLFLAFVVLDWALLTAKLGGVQKDCFFLPDGSCGELSVPGMTEFFASDAHIKNPDCAARMWLPIFAQLVRTCARSLQAAHVDEMETAFLFATLLHQMTELLASKTDGTLRNVILDELRSHYESSDGDVSIKMGNLVLLSSPLLQTALEMREFVSVLELEGKVSF